MSIAIITGASSGIGREFAKQLKEKCGIDEFWFVARRRENMEALRDELGVKAEIICADLASAEGIEQVKAKLEEQKPSVKYLVNAAGFGNFGAFDELPEEDVAGMIDLNVKATVLLTHIVVPYMERGGKIVELGSGSCFTPLPYFNVYSSSKVFVLHYTKSLNHELKKYGIRATCLCPGWVETEFLEKAKANGKTHPKAMKPTLRCEAVVAKCIKAVKRGRAMCVMGWYTKMQHVLFKLVPDFILTKIWLGMLVHPKGESKNGEN